MNENKYSVLIVDDEKSNISEIREILSPVYTIYAARSGTEAVETAEEFVPDVILLDILMPEMDGYDVITKLKKSDKTRMIPVIFVTGLDGEEDEEKGLELGAADYIAKPFSSAIVKLRVQNQIKIIEHIRTIENISTTDHLTGIANRRAFDNHMLREWGRTVREKLPVTVLMVDIDNFKNYNDTYGHNQGDVALQMVAQTAKFSVKRSADIAARWGGEEFIILLPNTDERGAKKVAERIRANVENMPISLPEGGSVMITVSVGTNTISPTTQSSMGEFLENADVALYEAKSSGKNRACHYDSQN
jgi:diguanylate cyclase (GGDEF)-like protein